METYSTTLAWKIPWTEEPGRLQSMGLLGVGRLSDFTFTFTHWRREWQPTPVSLPGESQGRRSWWELVYGVAQSRTRLKRLSSSSSSRVGMWDWGSEKSIGIADDDERVGESLTVLLCATAASASILFNPERPVGEVQWHPLINRVLGAAVCHP